MIHRVMSESGTSTFFTIVLGLLITVLIILFLVALKKSIIKREIPDAPYVPEIDNTRDLTILSVEKRTDTTYHVSVESLTETISPVKSAMTMSIPVETFQELINRVRYTSDAVIRYLNGNLKSPLERPESELRKMGTVLYRYFIPREFADRLTHHYLLCEAEDMQIPWELLYSDQYFGLKYAISRRIKSERVTNTYVRKQRKKKALIIVDPTERVPEAISECQWLKKALQNFFEVTYLKPEKAKKHDVMYHFSQEYDIIHYAGDLDDESCLPVYRDVLTCEEIEKTLEGSPLVFINGCGSAKGLTHDVGGLARVFLERGALSFVGSLWSIHDEKAAALATEFYKNTLWYPVGEALRSSREKYYSSFDITWAAFVMYGDPTLRLF
jgi:CHAT domain-containing protein